MLDIPKGKYIVAVSGGVDSMVLLDMLRQQAGLDLVVAHVDHGIRTDSGLDEQLVATFCMSHNILFESKKLHLGQNTSEATARKARYEFLQNCRIKFNATAIITAHHQDDLVETVLLNLRRGTGWRGLAPLANNQQILRPLLQTPKSDLVAYAKRHNIPWRGDSTNQNQKYLRNYIRLTLVSIFNARNKTWAADILRLVRNQQSLRRKIEAELSHQLTSVIQVDDRCVKSPRYFWIMQPNATAYELWQALCRRTLGESLVANLANDALLFIKVAKAGKHMPLNNQWQLRVTTSHFIVEPRPVVVS